MDMWLRNGLLNAILVAVFVGTVLGQALVPVIAQDVAGWAPEVRYLVLPLSILGILGIACVQAALICIVHLLRRVRSGEIFNRAARPYVTGIITAIGVATALSAATFLLLIIVDEGDPATGLFLLAAITGGVFLMLLMFVMRELLDRATRNQTELAEVI
ncbi:MAG: DUF2975 domain-containing protein [Promicromonosporaceae bacterium]|nr:DUF2975 domain-containing protein [Promicromonosporaceae bacterium]